MDELEAYAEAHPLGCKFQRAIGDDALLRLVNAHLEDDGRIVLGFLRDKGVKVNASDLANHRKHTGACRDA